MANKKDVPRIMVFRPTMEEFKDFSKYITYIESQGANRAGLAKIIPPKEWKPRKNGYEDIDDLVIPAPICQEVQGRQGLYQQYNIQKKSITVKEYRKMAESDKYQTPSHFDYEELERRYWKNITYVSPMYGADVSGSLYDEDVDEFNINRLNTCLDLIGEDYKIKIEGVNTAYLYFGMWKTTFAWHTEDMDLYSINYVHFGAPKSWYAIPPEHGKRLERLAAGFFPSSSNICPAFLRHKMTIISPQILKQYSIPVNKITQEPGEFMITFPYGYHSGYNHGFNCAESTNFAIPRWIEYGKRCSQCTCRNDSVKISMESFVKKYQPERYELWLQGKDMGSHPEDPSKVFAAPPPTRIKNTKFDRKMGRPGLGPKRHPAHVKMQKSEDKSGTASKIDRPDVKVELKPEVSCEVNCNNISQQQKRKFEQEQSSLKKCKPVEVDISLQKGSSKPLKVRKVKNALQSDKESILPVSSTNIIPALEDLSKEHSVLTSSQLTVSVVDNARVKSKPTSTCGELTISAVPNRKSVMLNNLKPKSEKTLTLSLPPWMSEEHALIMKLEPSESTVTHILPDIPSYSESISSSSQNPCVQTVDAASSLLALSQQPSFPVETVLPDLSTDHLYCSKSSSSSMLASSSYNSISTSACESVDNNYSSSSFNNCDNVASDASQNYGSEIKQAWNHFIDNIWQNNPKNLDIEKKFNTWCSLVKPHCSVCMIFKNVEDVIAMKDSQNEVPAKSVIEIPTAYYELVMPQKDLVAQCEPQPLLICSECNVCVHAFCYGVTDCQSSTWKCDKCVASTKSDDCSLCNLRGGALKPTNSGKWVHMTCALVLPDITFKDSLKTIDCSNVSSARQLLKCTFCSEKFIGKSSKMACTQCTVGRCLQSFHVTCGYLAGVVYQKSEWPMPIQVLCLKHNGKNKGTKLDTRKLLPLRVGSMVVAKHKNARYYYCEITEVTDETFYTVVFDDGTFSEDLYPEDIVSHNCVNNGPPKHNSSVSVQWTDGNVYNGVFKETSTCMMCTVEFEDGSINKVKRINVYADGEELPKKVLSRLSNATEGRHIDIFDQNQPAQGKRIRHLNVKYSSESILPTNTFPYINT